MASRPWEKEALALAPVFIVGNARSGTSILYRSIQNHPSFTPAGGAHLVESWALSLLPGLVRPSDAQRGRLSMFLRSVDALNAVARDIEPLALRRRIVRRLARHELAPPAPLWLWKAAGEHHVVRRYFLEAQRSRGAKRLVEKTPSYVRFVPYLGAAFPGARFICIIRHPLDVFSSFRKRYEVDPVRSPWANITPDAFCALWSNDTRRALALGRADDRFLLVRYEEFTGRTEPTVRRVLDHVGESFDEACLMRGPDRETTQAYAKIPEERKKAYANLFSSVTGRTKSWEDHIDKPTAEALERGVHEAMALAGYEPKATRE